MKKILIILLITLFFSSCSQFSMSGGDTTQINNTINYVTSIIDPLLESTNFYYNGDSTLNNYTIPSLNKTYNFYYNSNTTLTNYTITVDGIITSTIIMNYAGDGSVTSYVVS